MKRRITIVAVGVLAMIAGPVGVSAASASGGVSVPARATVLCVYQDIVPLGFCVPSIY